MRLSAALYTLLLVCATALPWQAAAQVNPNQPKPAAPKPAAPEATSTAGTATIKVSCNAPCKFYVDGELKGTLKDDRVLRVNLRPGKYLFKTVGTGNAQDVIHYYWNVERDEVGTEDRYEADMESVTTARQKAQGAESDRSASEGALHTAASRAAQQALAELDGQMIRVAGGSFMMGCTGDQGSDCEDEEKPSHQVTVGSFLLSKYEVTQALWMAVMSTAPSSFTNCSLCPVESVSWEGAQEFIVKLNELTGKRYRLPTEAEWEYAARGGSYRVGWKYAGGGDLGSVGWYNGNSGFRTHQVGQRSPNELGLYDMSGNVWEWCSDWYDASYYGSSPSADNRGPAYGEYRVVRGGSWSDEARHCRVAYRVGNSPGIRDFSIGFRLARTE